MQPLKATFRRWLFSCPDRKRIALSRFCSGYLHFSKNCEKENMKQMKSKFKALLRKVSDRFRARDKGRMLYTAFAMPTILAMFPTNAFAADTIWSKASEIMKDIYTQVLAISTIAAVVTASIALLLMNFSKSGKTVDESRAWLKRIIITWAILNSLGFILAYITPFFAGGAWTA